MANKFLFTLFLGLGVFYSCSQNKSQTNTNLKQVADMTDTTINTDTAIFGAGCFWCVEAIYQSIKGVISVESGYAGGHVKNPTYNEVCSGKTGHAEVARIVFDPRLITYEQLLEVFWHSHDPTTLNRQGADVGSIPLGHLLPE